MDRSDAFQMVFRYPFGRYREVYVAIRSWLFLYLFQNYGNIPKYGNIPDIFWIFSKYRTFGMQPDLKKAGITGITHMEQEITIQRFGELRRALGYTQSEFAELLGISSTTADIERGTYSRVFATNTRMLTRG